MTDRSADSIFTAGELEEIRARGIDPQEAARQILQLRNPPGPVTLAGPCVLGNGIESVSRAEVGELTALSDSAASEGRVIKFVPASGAASRMFRDLLHYQRQPGEISRDDIDSEAGTGKTEAKETRLFLNNLERFAFYDELHRTLGEMTRAGSRPVDRYEVREILDALLRPDTMNYPDLPKALLRFHAYDEGARTSFEEHLVEGAVLTGTNHTPCKIHFTVSPAHRDRFEAFLEEVRGPHEQRLGVSFDVGFSVQKPETDTLSLDMQGLPAKNDDGSLIFRPAGHGALLENLQDLEADLVMVKNIDNVTVERLKEATHTWSKVLVGYLARLQRGVFDLLSRLDDATDENATVDAVDFANGVLHRDPLPDGELPKGDAGRRLIHEFLNRPIRVCGMVPNTGEPGGGPFWVKDRSGSTSLQIVEKIQLDSGSPEQLGYFAKGTHFNPVFMAFAMRDYRGQHFDLDRFVDPATASVSVKSAGGRDIKALERPGLWNGAMAHWHTVFLELPIEVFNPVKTVNDLLRDEHQAG